MDFLVTETAVKQWKVQYLVWALTSQYWKKVVSAIPFFPSVMTIDVFSLRFVGKQQR